MNSFNTPAKAILQALIKVDILNTNEELKFAMDMMFYK